MPWNPFDQDKFSREIFFARTLLQFTLFFFLWPLIDAFGEERQVTWKDFLRRPKMYIYLGSFENEALENKTEARSTQISKMKHPKLENEAP